MTAHIIDIDTYETHAPRKLWHRWRCSCGKAGDWLEHTKTGPRAGTAARRARNGGVRHQRAMDR